MYVSIIKEWFKINSFYYLLYVQLQCKYQTNTQILLAVQVGVTAPHDYVWDLHHNHEVSLPKH